MKDQTICHEENSAFLDALYSCLDSGLTLMANGKTLTRPMLAQSDLLREDLNWEGSFIRNEQGEMKGISFSAEPMRNTLLPK